jgi:hypothetical protein
MRSPLPGNGREVFVSKVIRTAGDIAGGLGALACLISGVARFAGTWTVAGIQIPALFNLGMGLMIFACLSKLHILTSAK